jgi:anti-sigma regulatory factor (Ser/Thr protein kinase)
MANMLRTAGQSTSMDGVTMGTSSEIETSTLEHPALLHADMDTFLSYLIPFVRASMENREPAFVAVEASSLAALREAVGAEAPGVTWADTREWHPNSSSRLRAFYEYVTEHLADGATRIRLVGEPVWHEGRPDLIREWTRYESVLNTVLAPFPVSLVCTYDTSRLDPAIVANARRTHPVVSDGKDAPSRDFLDPAELLRTWNPEPPPPPAWAPSLDRPADLSTARRFLREQAMKAGVTFERAMDMAMAANEILTNALRYGRGAVALWGWPEDERFLCQIQDEGPGIADPMAGYVPPAEAMDAGRGLWLARQLVDLLQIVPNSTGTTVRLQVGR